MSGQGPAKVQRAPRKQPVGRSRQEPLDPLVRALIVCIRQAHARSVGRIDPLD